MKTALTAIEVESTDCDRFVRRFKVSGCSLRTPFSEIVNADGIPKMREPYKPGSDLVASRKRIIVTANPMQFDVFVSYVKMNAGEAVGLDAPIGGSIDD